MPRTFAAGARFLSPSLAFLPGGGKSRPSEGRDAQRDYGSHTHMIIGTAVARISRSSGAPTRA